MQFDLETLDTPKAAIVIVRSENLDAGNVKTFKDAVHPLLAAHGTVLIDMHQIGFVDSSGLGALLSCLRTMNSKNGQLKLFGMAKPVQALFELVRMHRIFAIYPTREEALAAI